MKKGKSKNGKYKMIEDENTTNFLLLCLNDALEKMKNIERMFITLEEHSHYSLKNDDDCVYLRTMHRKLGDYIAQVEQNFFI